MLMRGLEQAASVCDGYTKNLMRPYDAEAKIQMSYTSSYSGQLEFDQILDTDAAAVVPYSLDAEKTYGGVQMFYQLKPLNSDSTYAILQNGASNGWSEDLNNTDLVTVVFESLGATYTGVSGDFMNLRDSEDPSGYKMLESAADLSDLVNTNGFNRYNSLLYSYLEGELASLGESKLPENTASESTTFDDGNLGDGMLIPLYDDIMNWSPGQIIDRDQVVEMVDVSMPLDVEDLSASQLEIDTEDDIADSGANQNNTLVILKSDEQNAKVSVSKEGDGTVTLTDESGNNASGQTLSSGTTLTAYVKPASGQVVKSVDLIVGNEAKVISLAGSESTEESAEEMLANMPTDSDGNYVFNFQVPYQKATLKVVFGEQDASLKTYDAEIVESEEGNIQFEANNGLLTQEHKEGDVVTVNVRPYTGKTVESILVKDADNSVITVEDITEDEVVYTPNSKVYTFTMPADDVTIEVTFAKGYTVSLSTTGSDECTAEFVYDTNNFFDESWLTGTATEAEGSEIEIKVDCPENYFVSEYIITNLTTSNLVLGDITDDGITFTMPASSVSVKVVFEEIIAGTHNASLTTSGSGKVYFLNEDGEKINSQKHSYAEGDTVTVETETSCTSWGPEVTVTDVSGNAIDVTRNGNQYSFVMPKANVIVDATFANKINVTINGDVGSLIFTEGLENLSSDGKSADSWRGTTIAFKEDSDFYNNEAYIDTVKVYDADGNEVEVTQDGNSYSVVAGEKDLTIEPVVVEKVQVSLDSNTEGIFKLSATNYVYPGIKVEFWLIDTSMEITELYAVDAEGNDVEIFDGDDEGEYYVVAGTSDIVITGRASSVYEVTYDFTNSVKYSYGLGGLASDDGNGTGTAVAGDQLYLYISNDSSYSSSHFSESHYIKDADGNEISTTSKTYTSGSYYYFTMPEGPITVHGYSAYHSGIYAPNPLSKGDTFTSGGIKYEITSKDENKLTVKVIGLADKEAVSITIPDTVTIDGVTYKVTEIGDGAFKDNKLLKKIVIGKNVVTIGKKAFYNCKALTTIEGGKNVTKIGEKAFYGANSLKNNSLTKVMIKDTDTGKEKTAKTGDTTQSGVFLVLMLGAVMAMSIVLWYKRKKLR